MINRLRNNFLTGLIVVAPIGITLYLTWTVVDYVDSSVLPQVLPLIPSDYHPDKLLPFSLPGLGLLIFIAFVTLVGGLATNFFGRELIKIGEGWVDRMPVVRSIYNALKQITETIFAENGASFDRACLVQYPRQGIWAIAFIATETKGEVRERASANQEMLSVFLPTTPNPTSGFLLFVPAADVIILDMTVEEAAKLIISAGLINPPEAGQTEPLTLDASSREAAQNAVHDAVRRKAARDGATRSTVSRAERPRLTASAGAVQHNRNKRPFSGRFR